MHEPRKACFTTEVNWCGKLYSATGVRHDPARIEGLLSLRRPETKGKEAFVSGCEPDAHESTGTRASQCPITRCVGNVAANVSRRTKRTATAKKITRAEWTTDVQQSWTRVKHLLEECVTLAQRCEKYTVRGFTDTSVLHWGAMVTQFPDADLRSCVHPSGMPPAPLVFV